VRCVKLHCPSTAVSKILTTPAAGKGCDAVPRPQGYKVDRTAGCMAWAPARQPVRIEFKSMSMVLCGRSRFHLRNAEVQKLFQRPNQQTGPAP
jgi:hypothetical protein